METQTDSIGVCLAGEDVMTQGQSWKLSWILFVCLSVTSPLGSTEGDVIPVKSHLSSTELLNGVEGFVIF